MKHKIIKGCLVTILLATVASGFRLPLGGLPKVKVHQGEKDDLHPSRSIRSAEGHLEDGKEMDSDAKIIDSDGGKADLDISVPLNRDIHGDAKHSINITTEEPKAKIENRADKDDVKLIESRAAKLAIPQRITAGHQFSPDRTGFLFGLFPFLTTAYPTRVRYRGTHHPPPPRPTYHPSTHIPHHNPHEPEYEVIKIPEPVYLNGPGYEVTKLPVHGPLNGPAYEDSLQPFPPDGPHFDEHVEDFKKPVLHDFHHSEGGGDFHLPVKPHHPSDPAAFVDQSFEFDFEPPDFFEHSGFSHPPEEELDYYLQNDDPNHGGGGGGGGVPHEIEYPMRPYSDDDGVEFFPPKDYEGFVPIIYQGPPKQHNHIPPGPKPGPPFHPPIKFMQPHDIKTIVSEGIYRGDIPFKEVNNDRDKITDDLDHGGIKGLDPEIIDFIQTNTKDYVQSNKGFTDEDYDLSSKEYHDEDYGHSGQDYEDDWRRTGTVK